MRRSTWFVVFFQACLILFSLILAWLLRFDFTLPYRATLFLTAPIIVVLRLATMSSFGLLHGWWRFTGVNDVFDIVESVVLGSATLFLVLYLILGITKFPRSIYVLEAILTIGLLAGVRLASRLLAESVREDISSSKRFAIIGAGFAAQMILREIQHRDSGTLAVACVDDDASKRGLRIQGVPVMGRVDELPRILRTHPAEEILIAIPSATAEQMQRIISICESTRLRFRTVPALRDFIAGQPAFQQLRDVNLEDLLGRDPVAMDLGLVREQIEGRTVLVTGAAGSIGSELCRQILQFHPRKLVCLDQSETGIFYLQRELVKKVNGADSEFLVADLADRERLFRLCAQYCPEVTYHAAAYKHGPLLESNVISAVKNNIFSFLHLLEASERSGCRTFVLISSDKAVQPTTVMGTTKRVCELILSCRPSRSMRCVSVRFGNVLGSHGSVVPLLQDQLCQNLPLTITHPEITRYFMTAREAASLVLQASAIGSPGEILVLDMGRPVRIVDLAHSLIRLSGKSREEVKIHFTGLRPGEKLHEELFYSNEDVLPTSCPKILRARGTPANWSLLERQLAALRASLRVDGPTPVRAALRQIVPEYFCQVLSAPHIVSQTDRTGAKHSQVVARAAARG
ncbi:MAG TPA: nucleoside-diphosphate sugar epimerase/dehydratase [Candidatus Acidoferrales bacterium]|nr:nucleoside-diphosphate sugar epimerase/dehydratase [Candidatus Acidoferrales bacterium]